MTIVKKIIDKFGGRIRGWTEYKGDYEKEFYDIITKSGKVHNHCWPNAGDFYTVWSGPSKEISGFDVEFFRRSSWQSSSVPK